MATLGYRFPEVYSVNDEDLFYHAAKLAEECGEVCQTICKRKNLLDTAEECMDVIYSAECILRKIGVTDKLFDEMVDATTERQRKRGRIREEGILL